jgi:hypothetical protein
MAWANWREGDGVGGGFVYIASSERVMTHMKAAGGCVREIWLVSGWTMG